jgi:hypothetical protein
MSHPADAARMTALVQALKKLGFTADADEIERRWAELLKKIEPDEPPEFHRCYPAALLDMCVDGTLEATREIGCDLASPAMKGAVRLKLNEAWAEIWRNPTDYLAWERQAVANLQASLRP